MFKVFVLVVAEIEVMFYLIEKVVTKLHELYGVCMGEMFI